VLPKGHPNCSGILSRNKLLSPPPENRLASGYRSCFASSSHYYVRCSKVILDQRQREQHHQYYNNNRSTNKIYITTAVSHLFIGFCCGPVLTHETLCGVRRARAPVHDVTAPDFLASIIILWWLRWGWWRHQLGQFLTPCMFIQRIILRNRTNRSRRRPSHHWGPAERLTVKFSLPCYTAHQCNSSGNSDWQLQASIHTAGSVMVENPRHRKSARHVRAQALTRGYVTVVVVRKFCGSRVVRQRSLTDRLQEDLRWTWTQFCPKKASLDYIIFCYSR